MQQINLIFEYCTLKLKFVSKSSGPLRRWFLNDGPVLVWYVWEGIIFHWWKVKTKAKIKLKLRDFFCDIGELLYLLELGQPQSLYRSASLNYPLKWGVVSKLGDWNGEINWNDAIFEPEKERCMLQ